LRCIVVGVGTHGENYTMLIGERGKGDAAAYQIRRR
jgi:hypothetical protein